MRVFDNSEENRNAFIVAHKEAKDFDDFIDRVKDTNYGWYKSGDSVITKRLIYTLKPFFVIAIKTESESWVGNMYKYHVPGCLEYDVDSWGRAVQYDYNFVRFEKHVFAGLEERVNSNGVICCVDKEEE